jgi:hypothetical protein
MQRFQRIQQLIAQDIGNRGIKAFSAIDNYTSLELASQSLFKNAKSVAIITGFNIPPPENDGPLGAMWIAKSLLRLGRKVAFVTDAGNMPMMQQLWEHENDSRHVDFVSFPMRTKLDDEKAEQEYISETDKLAYDSLTRLAIDHIISIERVGPAENNKYYGMRGRDITHLTGRVEAMFYEAKKLENPPITIGIGDGGNELGMGNVIDLVKEHTPNGPLIACTVPCTHLITCGVSNWGGYAIYHVLMSLANLSDEPLDVQVDRKRLEHLCKIGVVDGILGKSIMSVDGLDYETVHAKMINDIINL